MPRFKRPIVAVLLALCLGGCATSALDLAPARPDRPWLVPDNGTDVGGTRGTARGFVLPARPEVAEMQPAPAIDAAKIYTLAELIDLAESNNPATRIAWNTARTAALAAGVAESAFLPRLTATAIGGFQHSNGDESALGTGFTSDPSLSGSVSALSLEWLLFDFGQRDALVDAAKQQSLAANIAFTAAHQQLIYDVSVAFYDYAAARKRQVTATQALENAKSVQSAAESRYSNGVGTVMEAARARQDTAQADLSLVQATGAVRDAYLALLTAMGISPLTEIRIADLPARELSPSIRRPVDTIVADALARRPDVRGAYAEQKASQANIRAAQADFMPKFFLAASGTYNSGSLDVTSLPSGGQQPPTVNVRGHHLGTSVFFGVTIPLYDGGVRSAAVARARTEADSADARLLRTREDAVRQIVAADNALETGLSAYAAAEALRTASQLSFDAALDAYRRGAGSITDATLAENQLLQAKNASTTAYSMALSAAAMLALATGALGAAPP